MHRERTYVLLAQMVMFGLKCGGRFAQKIQLCARSVVTPQLFEKEQIGRSAVGDATRATTFCG